MAEGEALDKSTTDDCPKPLLTINKTYLEIILNQFIKLNNNFLYLHTCLKYQKLFWDGQKGSKDSIFGRKFPLGTAGSLNFPDSWKIQFCNNGDV